MKNLVLDIGNLRIKSAVFEGDAFLDGWDIGRFKFGIEEIY